ncbi:MAG: creatininase family protein [Phycisphaerae bacterium]
MAGVVLSELSLEDLQRLPSGQRELAILPVGSLEQHGPHLPLGTDTLCAEALARLLAERTGGTVLPALPFTWTGGTRAYPVAINISNRVVIGMLESLFDAVRRAGFARLAVVNWHGGSGSSLRIAVREYFCRTGWPVVALKPRSGIEAHKRLSQRLKGNDREASCVLGSLIVLGQGHLVEPLMQRLAEAAAEFEGQRVTEDFAGLAALHAVGLVGHDYAHECRHVFPTLRVDPQAGLEYLRGWADYLAPAVEALGRFQQELAGGGGA